MALNEADVGIAMGDCGSDVAIDASDIVLTDDNFSSILAAIEEGRRMFSNIQKFVLHLLAQNVALALVLLVGLSVKDQDNISVFPISPVEIMWIIMVTSSFPDMGLGFEEATHGIMQELPKNVSENPRVCFNPWTNISSDKLGCFYSGNHCRYLVLWYLDRYTLPLFLYPGYIPIRKWPNRIELQRTIFRILRRRVSSACYNFCMLNMVFTVPCLGVG